jgi:molecular chaperone DnaK (HSP70)
MFHIYRLLTPFLFRRIVVAAFTIGAPPNQQQLHLHDDVILQKDSFAVTLFGTRILSTRSRTSTSITKLKNGNQQSEFSMPSPKVLISDLPKSQRGIGVGIDLGTTNSAVAILSDDGIPTIIPIHGKSTLPSVVTLSRTATNMNTNMNNTEDSFTYRNVKRIMGMSTNSAACNSDIVPYLLINSSAQRKKGISLNIKNKKQGFQSIGFESMMKEAYENPAKLALPPYSSAYIHDHHDSLHLTVGNVPSNTTTTTAIHELVLNNATTTSPEYISSLILQKLFQTTESVTNEKITRVVIGVPAYFNDLQREATVKAAMLASNIPRERIRLLREPEAAALAYGIGKRQIGKRNDEELVLVFDLGGGTFDVSVLEVGGGIYEVVATGGNNMLGGSDFDARLGQYISKKLCEHGCVKNYWKEGGLVANAYVNSAEQIRIALSNCKEVVLSLPLNPNGWLSLRHPKDVIVSRMTGDERYLDVTDVGMSNTTHVICKLTRRSMESLCIDEFLALLRPLREVAILAGVLLPGDASPAAVEAVLQMEEEFEKQTIESNQIMFDSFYEEGSQQQTLTNDSSRSSSSSSSGDINEQTLLQLKEFDLKQQKKAQQKGRKRARNVQKDERKYREEKRKAAEISQRADPYSQSNVKIRDGIKGRRLTQVVLVGGATRMPAIGRLLAAVTGVVPQKTVDPDEAVALGCAVQVGILDGINTDLTVLSPIEAAMMRAIAKQRGLDTIDDEDDDLEGYEVIEEFSSND